jgi:NADH:ubiquinone oxidoreductase subunit 2 (subunit N)
MSAILLHSWTLWAPALALIASAVRLAVDRVAQGRFAALAPIVVVLPLAAIVAAPLGVTAYHAPLIAALVIAILARDRGDSLQSECALKLAWVLGGSLALSWAGGELLALVAGSRVNAEQWAVLGLSVVPGDLWSVALPLALLAGLVMLGGAPFHFWPADLLQGGRTWVAPLAAAALQICGAAWLSRRLDGIAALPAARLVAIGLLTVSLGVALAVGAATLLNQRRPERRVGTLASLQGALALAVLIASGPGPIPALWFERWAAHLAIALTGAALLARFLPVASGESGHAGVLFRRHPAAGLAGMLACFSLAGVPGTPGAWLWLEAARALGATRHVWLLVLLGLAWAVAFSTVMRQWREAAAIPEGSSPSERPVPARARAALWISGAGVLALGFAWLAARG